ncbi:hypothetical protein EV561_1381 [Rhizobium sp. BK376]|nr:hypothetical protein EV561_1381 [Rhizobium sp. BK376]
MSHVAEPQRCSRSAATDAFGGQVGILFRHAGFNHGTDDAANGSACNRICDCTCSRRRKPSCSNERTDAWDCKGTPQTVLLDHSWRLASVWGTAG